MSAKITVHFSKICHFVVSPNEVSIQNKSFRGHVCRVHALETVMEYNMLTKEQVLAIRQSQGYTDVPNQCGFWSGSGSYRLAFEACSWNACFMPTPDSAWKFRKFREECLDTKTIRMVLQSSLDRFFLAKARFKLVWKVYTDLQFVYRFQLFGAFQFPRKW